MRAVVNIFAEFKDMGMGNLGNERRLLRPQTSRTETPVHRAEIFLPKPIFQAFSDTFASSPYKSKKTPSVERTGVVERRKPTEDTAEYAKNAKEIEYVKETEVSDSNTLEASERGNEPVVESMSMGAQVRSPISGLFACCRPFTSGSDELIVSSPNAHSLNLTNASEEGDDAGDNEDVTSERGEDYEGAQAHADPDSTSDINAEKSGNENRVDIIPMNAADTSSPRQTPSTLPSTSSTTAVAGGGDTANANAEVEEASDPSAAMDYASATKSTAAEVSVAEQSAVPATTEQAPQHLSAPVENPSPALASSAAEPSPTASEGAPQQAISMTASSAAATPTVTASPAQEASTPQKLRSPFLDRDRTPTSTAPTSNAPSSGSAFGTKAPVLGAPGSGVKAAGAGPGSGAGRLGLSARPGARKFGNNIEKAITSDATGLRTKDENKMVDVLPPAQVKEIKCCCAFVNNSIDLDPATHESVISRDKAFVFAMFLLAARAVAENKKHPIATLVATACANANGELTTEKTRKNAPKVQFLLRHVVQPVFDYFERALAAKEAGTSEAFKEKESPEAVAKDIVDNIKVKLGEKPTSIRERLCYLEETLLFWSWEKVLTLAKEDAATFQENYITKFIDQLDQARRTGDGFLATLDTLEKQLCN